MFSHQNRALNISFYTQSLLGAPQCHQGFLMFVSVQWLTPGAWIQCVWVTHKGEVWCILAQQSGEDRLSLDPLLVLKHVAIHEAVQQGGVGMDIDVELQTNPLKDREREGRDGDRQKMKYSRLVGMMGASSPHRSSGNNERPLSWIQLPGELRRGFPQWDYYKPYRHCQREPDCS